ncbi:endonuclease V isoform X1 [Sagmatias obliquidens]|uniref:endonuclease V isoform X1 n=1 Tax=Sagmatias obliquidens TaxID=3371155 RepID=UPI000F4403EA|nr:endonuclease V isoform X1 [Lagenorhynchus obliquidens]
MARKAAGRPPEETLSLWKREQALLKTLVVDRDTEAWQRDPAFSGLQRVGGVDVSFVKGDSVSACASLVVLSYPELEVMYEDCRMVSLTAPYVSGFLAFREVSFLVDAVQQLREKEPRLMPQVLFVDGNGVLHHRGFGVACHLGVVTDLPCIGVAKKLLQVDGLENNALHKEKIRLLKAGGDSFPLMGGSGTVLGMALKSHDHSTKPLYVSVGHKMSLEAAVRLTHGCCKFRIPEPVRQADIRSRDYIRRTLGVQGAPALRPERSKKAQRPKACPQGASEEPAGSPSLRAFSAKDGNEPHQKKWPKLQQRIWGREKEALWEVGSQKMKGLWDPPFPLGRRGRAASLASWTWRSWGSEAQEGLGALKEMGCSCCLALGKRQ